MAEKKVTPRAATGKSEKTGNLAATRVTKRTARKQRKARKTRKA